VTGRAGAIAPDQLLDAMATADRALDATPVRAGGKPPVEMIPGFVMPLHTFFPIRSALRKAGYADMTIMNQWPWFGRIEEYAAIARMHVDAAKKRLGTRKVDVIGHSMGGLTARALVKYNGGEKDVAHVVTMGTPHHGTVLGNIGGIALPSCKEMSLGSDFLKQLNAGDETPGAIPYTSIHCSWDEIVIPGRSVDLEGADNPKVNHTFHIEMMMDPETIRLVLEGLNK
jgi:triacylglycerol esterase/lipase EstA (alpha/beta hydrolase family)